jgi:phosphoglycolate phosphatase
MKPFITFDLDGTLIDSRLSTIESLQYALEKNHIKLEEDKINSISIGPTLDNILKDILPEPFHKLHECVKEDFKNYYDNIAYKEITPFKNIENLINELVFSGAVLAIITNKRSTPTLKIIKHLGWSKSFKEVISIDKSQKNEIKETLLIEYVQSNRGKHVYVGDTEADMSAASAAAIPFYGVMWGYGRLHQNKCQLSSSPEQLLAKLKAEVL